MKRIFKNLYLILVLVFLYAPIMVMTAQSFNASKYRGHWTYPTLKWYTSLFSREDILEAFRNTLTVGLLSSLIATLIGLLTCIAVVGMKKRRRVMVLGISNVSMLNADIVTGISLMLLFLSMGIRFGYGSVLLSHSIFNIPYAVLNILPGISALDLSIYESALDLGAKPLQAFRLVIFPDIFPGILSGFLMGFAMSADDFIITHFTKGVGMDTLPTIIYSELKLGIHPEMYALTTLLTGSLFLLFILIHLNRRHILQKDTVREARL